MIRAILFPTDFSAVANSAFPLALAVAAQYDAIVQSVHISHGGDPHITETSRYEFPAAPTGASAVRVIETIVPKDDTDPAQVIMSQAEQRTSGKPSHRRTRVSTSGLTMRARAVAGVAAPTGAATAGVAAMAVAATDAASAVIRRSFVIEISPLVPNQLSRGWPNRWSAHP